MLHKLRKRSIITKEEIIADLIFLLVSFLISILVLYIFDIHWNFYPNGQLFPPAKYVFNDRTIYLYGGLLGSILGFFIIKLFLIGIKEEENKWTRKK